MAPFIIGFPLFLSQIGMPAIVVDTVGAVESFMVFWGIIEWISGRIASQQ